MEGDTSRKALFSNPKREVEATENAVDLTALLEPSMLFLRQDTPQEVVISMFQKLVRRLFTEGSLVVLKTLSPRRTCAEYCLRMQADYLQGW